MDGWGRMRLELIGRGTLLGWLSPASRENWIGRSLAASGELECVGVCEWRLLGRRGVRRR